MSEPIQITILGSRGSMPVSGKAYQHYGGATTCIKVRHPSGTLFLDAGTGLMAGGRCLQAENETSLILTHSHFDHITGLCMFPDAFRKGFRINVYGAQREGLSVREQIESLMAPPLWPVGPMQLPAEFRFHSLQKEFTAAGIQVETMEGNHPGGVSVLRLTIGEKRIVLMTDCTITRENRDKLLNFCRNCDLLLCDGQYSDEEWLTRSSFGHNTWNEAARFARDCGAKCTRILHHDPTHSDEILDTANTQVQMICSACALAFDGEEMTL